jgi:hypothetical protein
VVVRLTAGGRRVLAASKQRVRVESDATYTLAGGDRVPTTTDRAHTTTYFTLSRARANASTAPQVPRRNSSAPVAIEDQAPQALAHGIVALSCGSPSLCVAINDHGDALASGREEHRNEKCR